MKAISTSSSHQAEIALARPLGVLEQPMTFRHVVELQHELRLGGPDVSSEGRTQSRPRRSGHDRRSLAGHAPSRTRSAP